VSSKKKFARIGVAFAVLAVIAAALVWWAMGQPLYQPGMVRAGKNLRGPLEPPPQTAGDGYWLVEPDVRLAYHAQGEGRPIVVVHGGPGIPIHEPPAGFERLSRNHKLYYYDQRGCGGSTRPFDRFESSNFYQNMTKLEQTLGIGAQVADIERIRRLLGQDRLLLLGHSFGAFLAAMYAAEFPERVDALVLVAPAGVLVLPDPGVDFFGEIRKRLPTAEQGDYDRFLADYLNFGSVFTRSEAELAQMNRRLGDYFRAAGGDPPREQQAAGVTDNGGWMVQAVYFSMGRRHDYRPLLAQVMAPVLVIHGEDDLLPALASLRYVESFPKGRLHLMGTGGAGGNHAGHFVFRDQPDAFATAVERFLGERR
jgi:proline iminopeptidase